MMRLKAFLEGKADSRQEVQGVITLEQMQARHRALRAQLESLDPGDHGRAATSRPGPSARAAR